jgi:hypothetical protein
MKPDSYRLIQQCVENGVAAGLHRAYKHNESPSAEQVQDAIYNAVMHEICEWFKFEDIYGD